MKKILCYICICMIFMGNSASAIVSQSAIDRVNAIKTELENGENTEQLVGEMAILMLENNVLNKLAEDEENEYAADLKSSADAALDASAAGSDNAQTLAIDFADKLAAVPLETTYKTNDGSYIPVQELEHYALTVDNSSVADQIITVTVTYYSESKEEVKITAIKSDATTATKDSSMTDRVISGNDKVFNFTTPKNCNYIKVNADNDTLSLPLNIEITNEVINNGSLYSKNGKFYGWYTNGNTQSTYYDNSMPNSFVMTSNTTTNVTQYLTLKENTTYCLTFRYARKTSSTAEVGTMVHPTLYFDKLSFTTGIATSSTVPAANDRNTTWGDDTKVIADAPAKDSDWREYELYFTTQTYAGTSLYNPGLVQMRLVPRNYETSGVAYYDDFSIKEIDGGSYISYRASTGSSSDSNANRNVSGKNVDAADKVRYHYVKKDGDSAKKFVYAEYAADDKLSYVKLIDVSVSGDYDIPMNDKTKKSKIFLLDGESLIPQMSAVED